MTRAEAVALFERQEREADADHLYFTSAAWRETRAAEVTTTSTED